MKTAMKKKKGFDFGRMVIGCVLVAFVSVFAWIMSDVFFAPSLKGYEAVPCRIVKSSVKMEKVNRFVFTAEIGFTVPGNANDGCNLAFGAKVKLKGVSRAFTLTYPLPNPIS